MPTEQLPETNPVEITSARSEAKTAEQIAHIVGMLGDKAIKLDGPSTDIRTGSELAVPDRDHVGVYDQKIAPDDSSTTIGEAAFNRSPVGDISLRKESHLLTGEDRNDNEAKVVNVSVNNGTVKGELEKFKTEGTGVTERSTTGLTTQESRDAAANIFKHQRQEIQARQKVEEAKAA